MKCTFTDNELLINWRSGDIAAFNILFERYFNKLLQFTHKRISDRECAEELVMNVMLRLYQRRDHLNPSEELGPYLYTSVKNAIIDKLRIKTLKTLSIDSELMANLAIVEDEQQHNAKELHSIYTKSLAKLSPQRKMAFELSRHSGKSHKEISLQMNVSVSTVKQHINASLHVIREALKSHTDIAFFLITILFLKK